MTDVVMEIRPGEDGRLYISLYQKEPFYWKALSGGKWKA